MNWRFWVIANMLVTVGWAVFSRLTRQHFSAQVTSLIIISFAWITVFITNANKFVWSWNIGWLWAICCGIFGGLTNITYYRFIKDAPFNSAMPLNEIYLAIVPVFAYLVFGEMMTIRQGLGLLTTFLTMWLLLGGK